MTIKLFRNGALVGTYANWNQATSSNGSKSGKNANASKNWLINQGFTVEVDGVIVEKDSTVNGGTRKAASKHSIVERVIKLVSIVDTEALKAAEEERTQLFLSTKTSADFEKNAKRIQELNAKIEALSNPTPTREAVVNKFIELYDSYISDLEAEEENEEENEEA